jgi:glutamyl-tRNA reductase
MADFPVVSRTADSARTCACRPPNDQSRFPSCLYRLSLVILQVVYCNHQTADLSVRERLAFPADRLERAYGELRSRFPRAEAVVLSTCNRVEVYTAQEAPDDAPSHRELAEFFADFHGVPINDFIEDFLERTGPDAVRHLFSVASSVDSMVLGEPQIVSQVKDAYQLAQDNDACGPLTHAMFQGAIRVSSRVRTETKLAEGRVSIASVAVGEFGRSIFDRFDDKTVLIVGAGEMAEETLTYLQTEGVRDIIVCNRSPDRAAKLAAAFEGARTAPYDQLDDLLGRADVVVSTTGASEPIVDVPRLSAARRSSESRPLFILDLGAPRDFAPGTGDVDDNVFLYDIDDLEATCERNRKSRSREIDLALKIIDDETDGFMHEVYHRATGPIIKRLREQWHEISTGEMAKLQKKLGHLNEPDLATIEKSLQQIINKLLHPPLEALRNEAKDGTPHGLLDALKRLFHLDR